MKHDSTRRRTDHRPAPRFASPGTILSELAQIRADLIDRPLSVCHIETRDYCCDRVEGIDRLMRDIRAKRVSEFRIDEDRWGDRRIIINYFGR